MHREFPVYKSAKAIPNTDIAHGRIEVRRIAVHPIPDQLDREWPDARVISQQYRARARAGGLLLGDDLPRAPELSGKVLQLGQSVTHGQDRFSIVHMHLRHESEVRNGRGKNVGHL